MLLEVVHTLNVAHSGKSLEGEDDIKVDGFIPWAPRSIVCTGNG